MVARGGSVIAIRALLQPRLYHCFFSSRRRHTRSLCDWSSDVCSSDLDCPLVNTGPRALLAVSVIWCGESSLLIHITAWPGAAVSRGGPKENPLMRTSGAPVPVVPPPPIRPASEITKSCFSWGLWHWKQPV